MKSFYDYHIDKFRNRIPPTIIGLIGQLTCVFRHYVSYADLLKVRYSPFQCLIMVGTEDRLVREKNSYIIRRVRIPPFDESRKRILSDRFLAVDCIN